MGGSLIIAFALSRFWWHWQRKAKSVRVWAQTCEGGPGRMQKSRGMCRRAEVCAEGLGHMQKGQGACIGARARAEGLGHVQMSWGMWMGAVACRGVLVRAGDGLGTRW